MTRRRDRIVGRTASSLILDDIRDSIREAITSPSHDGPQVPVIENVRIESTVSGMRVLVGDVVVGGVIEDIHAPAGSTVRFEDTPANRRQYVVTRDGNYVGTVTSSPSAVTIAAPSPPPIPGDQATYSFSQVSDGSSAPWHIYRLSRRTQRQRHVASAMTKEEAEWIVRWRSARSTLDSEEYAAWASNHLSILPKIITAELRGAALVRGLDYYRSLRVGQPLALVRDPQNESGSWAIVAKTIESRAVAYVAREIAFHLGRSMDQGAMWVAEVLALPRLHTYATIKISRVESRKRRARTP